MAACTFRQLPKCNEQTIRLIYTNPGELQKMLGIPVIQGPPDGYMEFVDALPKHEEIVFPKEQFVTYQESDARWAVPLGIAKVVSRNIREGDVVTVTLNGDSMRVAITFVGIKQSEREMRRYVVNFYLVSFLTHS